MIDKLLDKIDSLIKKEGNVVHFRKGISAAEIDKVQSELGFVLPLSFFRFLRRFNGGFISIVESDSSLDIQEWNSNTILSIEETSDAFRTMRYKWEEDSAEIFIPVIRTDGGEYLGFMNPLKNNESMVYDLWHETFPHEWKEMDVYDSFEDLLDDYITNKGEIATLG